MKNRAVFILLLITSTFICSFTSGLFRTSIQFEVPKNWPKPHYNFKKNPLTEEGFQLGRRLFYDTKLSRDNTISCSSCHLQYTGFTHVDHAVSHGIDGRKGNRNAPALINLAWNSSFHWAGGVNHLDVQAINPIQDKNEMDQPLDSVLHYLNQSPSYRKQFYIAFGDSVISTADLLYAITQFTVSLVSAESKYDAYINGETKFTEQEENGLRLFNEHCNSCHTAPLFNSNKYKSNGIPIDSIYHDLGRYSITKNPKDSLLFRVPTLRNIQYTEPYMHDGRFAKLRDVIDYYSGGLDENTTHLSKELKNKFSLSGTEKKDLISFLYTLSDKKFLYNKRYSFPR